MATPVVPARPARATAGPTVVKDSMPSVPPRPIRKLEPSPARAEDNRSPLNDLPEPFAKPGSRRASRANLAEAIQRPPSVSLPSVGQEGSEYASFNELPPEARIDSSELVVPAPQQTRNVSANMPLHAPKASVSLATAKSRIATVTHTDSTQAAAAGIGQAKPEDDVHRHPTDVGGANASPRPLRVIQPADDHAIRRISSAEPHHLGHRAPSMFRVPSNQPSSSSKPGSIHENMQEHGIPEIGMQIPLYPNAGDVQAPTPGPAQTQHAPGIGFFNDGSARAHQRRRSSRQVFGPPDSYGLHGHGVESHDQFERAWVAKHPKESAMEGYNVYGHFHVPRPEHALSTDELNKIVNHASDTGMGTDPRAMGTPSWEIANQATEEYTSRYSSPSLAPVTTEAPKPRSSLPHPSTESPLHNAVSASNALENVVLKDDGTIHIVPLERRPSRTRGSSGPASPAQKPRGSISMDQLDAYEDQISHTPILASDEAVKRPSSAFMHPAVSPELKPSDDDYQDGEQGQEGRRSSTHGLSRPSSRPNSSYGAYHGGNLHRFISHDDHHQSGIHTPLEEIDEYEPLFPDEESAEAAQAKLKPKAIPKRPGLEHHHFPSQDIWEDTPSSLQYQATVETPELEPQDKPVLEKPVSSVFETPEQELQRRNQAPDDVLRNADYAAKPANKLRDRLERPGVQRFPSQDIWEDSPDSMYLVTTLSGSDAGKIAQGDDAEIEEHSPTAPSVPDRPVRPSIPARPQRKSKLAEELQPETVVDDEVGDDLPTEHGSSQLEEAAAVRQAPVVPERPKPSVPARPAARAVEPESETTGAAAPAVKPKPPIVSRLGGEKLAALKAGFMNDLNQRLKLGPTAPPKPTEPEPDSEEAAAASAPLTDARKSRTRGPARRKPGVAADNETSESTATSALSFSSLPTVWHVDDASGLLHVPSHESSSAEKVTTDAPKPIAPSHETDALAGAPIGSFEPSSTTRPAEAGDGEASIGTELAGLDADQPAAAHHSAEPTESIAAPPVANNTELTDLDSRVYTAQHANVSHLDITHTEEDAHEVKSAQGLAPVAGEGVSLNTQTADLPVHDAVAATTEEQQ